MQQPLTQYIEYQKNNQLTFPYSYQGLSREVADLLEEAWEKQKINMNKDIIFTGKYIIIQEVTSYSKIFWLVVKQQSGSHAKFEKLQMLVLLIIKTNYKVDGLGEAL